MNRYHSVLGSWTAARGDAFVNALHVSVSTYLNTTEPGGDAAAADLPEHSGRRLVPHAAGDAAAAAPARRQRDARRAARTAFGSAASCSASTASSASACSGRAASSWSKTFRLRSQRRRPHRRQRPAVCRDAAQRQAGPAPDPAGLRQHARLRASSRTTGACRTDLQLNLGLRYEVDTEVNNQSRVDELNPLVLPFVNGERKRDLNNLARASALPGTSATAGLTCAAATASTTTASSSRSSRSSAGSTAARCRSRSAPATSFFLDPGNRPLSAVRADDANPFTGFILPGAGASGINIIDSHLQNPMVQEVHLGVEHRASGLRGARGRRAQRRATDFLIGRTVGEVFNPVVGGPDRVVNIESSAEDEVRRAAGLARSAAGGGHAFRRGYTLAKSFNYANDDQIPFSNGPIDPNDLRARVRADAQRSPASVRRVRAGHRRRRRSTCRRLDRVLRCADGHHDARRLRRAFRCCSATRADASSRRRRS